jgi:hypothetical protein
MMRIVLSTPQVFGRLDYSTRPFNFLFCPLIDPVAGYPAGVDPDQCTPITAFTKDRKRWSNAECINVRDGKRYQLGLRQTSKLDKLIPQTFGYVLRLYLCHPEAKSLAPDGTHSLESLRGDEWRRGENARFTWAGRSRYVHVEEVHSTVTTARSTTVRLRLRRAEPQRDQMLNMTIDGRSPDDLTETALRTALFGEANPLAKSHMGFMSEISDPLQPLREAPVSEEIVRPLSELLIVDELVGSGRAVRVTDFKLGVPVRGERPLTLSWEPPQRYSGERKEPRTIEGNTRL